MRNRLVLTMVVLTLVGTVALSAGCSDNGPQTTTSPGTVTAANSGGGGMGGGGMSASGGDGDGMVNGVVASAKNAGLNAEDVGCTSAGIVVDRVVAPVAGWLVAKSINPPFSVLGTAPIAQGENVDTLIKLTAADAADAFVALHIDRGTPGVFEFNPARPRQSQDAAVYVDSAPMQVPVRVTGFGADVMANSVLVLVKDQTIRNRAVVVDYLITPEPVWVCVNLLEEGLPGKQIGLVSRPPGEQQSIVVPLNRTVAPGDMLVVTIHADKGLPGVFEFDHRNPFAGVDQPYVAAGVLVSRRISLK